VGAVSLGAQGCVRVAAWQRRTSLLVDRSPLVDVDHLGRAVLHRRVRVDVELDLLDLLERLGRRARVGRAAKVAQLKRPLAGLEDVFDLEVAVDKGLWPERVHLGDALADVDKDLEDLLLRQARLEPRVEQVNDAAAGAELHQNQDLMRAVRQVEGIGVVQMNDVRVTAEQFLGGGRSNDSSRGKGVRWAGVSELASMVIASPTPDSSCESDNLDIAQVTAGESILSPPPGRLVPSSPLDDRAAPTHHDFDLPSDLIQQFAIPDCDALEDMRPTALQSFNRVDKIDVGEAACRSEVVIAPRTSASSSGWAIEMSQDQGRAEPSDR
jgi:hypothetical protein